MGKGSGGFVCCVRQDRVVGLWVVGEGEVGREVGVPAALVGEGATGGDGARTVETGGGKGGDGAAAREMDTCGTRRG